MPNGPACSQAGATPRASIVTGSSNSHTQTAKPATMPAITARGGVCGRQMAKPSAGARVASAENDTAPTSASASLPAIRRLYAHASSITATMPMRRCASTAPRRSPPVPRSQPPRNRPGASQWLPIIRLSVSVLTTTMPVAALSPPRKASSARPCCPCDNGNAST